MNERLVADFILVRILVYLFLCAIKLNLETNLLFICLTRRALLWRVAKIYCCCYKSLTNLNALCVNLWRTADVMLQWQARVALRVDEGSDTSAA